MSTYKAGVVLQITSGEYSDKSTHAIARVKVDFDLETMIAAFKLTKVHDPDHDYYDHSEFVSWLSKTGVIEDIDYNVMHIGSYGRLEAD